MRRVLAKVSMISLLAVAGASGCGKKSSGQSTNSSTTGGTNGSGTGSSSLTVSGTLALTALDLDNAVKPNEAVAFPLSNGAAKVSSLDEIIKQAIDNNGNFSFNLSSDNGTNSDYVIGLIDTTQPTGSQFVNFVGLPASNNADLLNLPMADAKGKLDAGTITPSTTNADAKATTTADSSATALGVSTDEIKQFAGTDGVLRRIKNIINNCEPTSAGGKCVDVQTTYQWNLAHQSASVGQFNQAADLTYYGYQFIINFANTSYKFADVCQSGNPYLITFAPPTNVTANNYDGSTTVYSSTSGISNQGLTTVSTSNGNTTCTSGTMNPAFLGENSTTSFNFIPFSGPALQGAIPAGNWVLKVTGPNSFSESYNFDLGSASPLDASNHSLTWMPVFQFSNDATTGDLSKVEVRFYTFDESTSAWVETTDPTAFLAAIGGAGVDGNTASGGVWLSVTQTNGGTATPDSIRLVQEPGTDVFVAQNFKTSWKFPAQAGQTCPTGQVCPQFRLSYTLRGTQMNFEADNY